MTTHLSSVLARSYGRGAFAIGRRFFDQSFLLDIVYMRHYLGVTMTLREAHAGIISDPARPAFVVAGGRVCGTEHVRTGRPCQDAFAWQRTDRCVLAVVCDGCGSGRHSEVGAQLGARLWTTVLARTVHDAGLADTVCADDLLSRLTTDIWPRTRTRVAARLAELARDMGQRVADVVIEHFLFTLVGALLTPEHTIIYSVGDGFYGVDDETHEIGPFADNRPPYLGYDVLENRPVHPITVHECRPTDAIHSIVLATDGISPLMAPGIPAHEGVGQFCAPRYVRNRDAIRRRLAVLNRDSTNVDWEAHRVARRTGLFRDDVAVVTVLRQPGASA